MSNPIYLRKYVAVARVRSRYENGRLTKGVYGYALIPPGNSGRERRFGRHSYQERRERHCKRIK